MEELEGPESESRPSSANGRDTTPQVRPSSPDKENIDPDTFLDNSGREEDDDNHDETPKRLLHSIILPDSPTRASFHSSEKTLSRSATASPGNLLTRSQSKRRTDIVIAKTQKGVFMEGSVRRRIKLDSARASDQHPMHVAENCIRLEAKAVNTDDVFYSSLKAPKVTLVVQCEPHLITKLVLNWYSSYAPRSYDILTSSDGANYKRFYEAKEMPGVYDKGTTAALAQGKYRNRKDVIDKNVAQHVSYIMIVMKEFAKTFKSYRLALLEVYGQAEGNY